MSDEGGTKIRRNRGPPPGNQPDAPMQMPQQQFQQGPPQFQQPPPQFQQPPPQYQQQQPHQIEIPQEIQIPSKSKPILKKSSFTLPGSGNGSGNMKTAMLVVVIFFMFNSKIFWRQITRLPMMGGFEPSIIALIVNSLLAGIVFYILSKLINK